VSEILSGDIEGGSAEIDEATVKVRSGSKPCPHCIIVV
jgi:hypothetical protein